MAHLVGLSVVYDWQSNELLDVLPRQEKIKLCVLELNRMYRGDEESPVTDAEYDALMNMITDETFKLGVGTGLGLTV